MLRAAKGRQLPAAEATARLELATLLLSHTHNVTEARQHLERAVRAPRALQTLNPITLLLAHMHERAVRVP